jgi:hypothetical protein
MTNCLHHHTDWQHRNVHFTDGNPIHYLELVGYCRDCNKHVQFVMGDTVQLRPSIIDSKLMMRIPFICEGDSLEVKKPGFSKVETGWTSKLP